MAWPDVQCGGDGSHLNGSEDVRLFAAGQRRSGGEPGLARLLGDDVARQQWVRLMTARLDRLSEEQQALVAQRLALAQRAAVALTGLSQAAQADVQVYLDGECLRHSIREASAFDFGLALGRAMGNVRTSGVRR